MVTDFYGGIDVYGKPKSKRQPIRVSQKNVVWDKQNGKCWFCKRTLKRSSTHYDHIKEVSRGGKSKTKNLRAICANCHYERHNKDKADRKKRKRKKAPWEFY